jgi:SNF2 family DNA or RNA helicase
MAGQQTNKQLNTSLSNSEANIGRPETMTTGATRAGANAANEVSGKKFAKEERTSPHPSTLHPQQTSGHTVIPRPNPAGSKRPAKNTKSAPRKKQKKAKELTSARRLKGTRAPDTLDRVLERLRRPLENANAEVDNEKVERDIKSLTEALNIFGAKAQKTDELYLIQKMKTPIYNFQLVGAGFMVRHERSRSGPVGGIIADDMGMGKTIQAIACMVTQPPSKKEVSQLKRATLVVVPNDGIMRQWIGELEKHVESGVIAEPFGYTGTPVTAHILKCNDCV